MASSSLIFLMAFAVSNIDMASIATRSAYLRENTIPVYPPIGRPDRNTELTKKEDDSERSDWVRVLIQNPMVIRVPMGTRLELTCEAMGSPPPSLRWEKGNQALVQHGFEESNDIGSTGLAKVKSKFIIDCVMPHHQSTQYTCNGIAGTESDTSIPLVLLVQGGNLTSLTSERCKAGGIIVPKITSWSPITMETMNSNIALPCYAEGNPKPHVYWLDRNNELIDEISNSRFKVLETGELLITKLRWEDMGDYKCVAENSEGHDSAVTFLYPMKEADNGTQNKLGPI